jgi:DNA recombination protein RmuC
MIETMLVIISILILVNIFLTLTKKDSSEKTDRTIRDEFQRNRSEVNEMSKANREELSGALKSFQESFNDNTKEINSLLRQKFGDFSESQAELNKQTVDSVKEVKATVEKNLEHIREDNNKQLEEMRKTVDEKLQETINKRLQQSFETVGKQLIAVQEGLGEMKNIAVDVGGLKKALSNVKTGGNIGEIQLSMLLEQILAPDQYEANVKTKKGSSDLVEFAIKLPGKDDYGSCVWLPIDAKFPRERYEVLITAYDSGDAAMIATAQKELDNAVKKMAKDISEKYIDPPNTTDFGIMFLPFEGIYAEVVRKASLLEEIQRNFKIIVTGPSTLAALLNSLQMGFKTLAIEKRSSEVWQTLGAVKSEFAKFGDLLQKAQNKFQSGLNDIDSLIGTRTKAIQRKLRGVEALGEPSQADLLTSIEKAPFVTEEDDEEND